MIYLRFNLYIFIYLAALTLSAQTRFIIASLPKVTPAEDTIFITGTFNNWAVNDPNYILAKQPNGYLAIALMLDKDSVYEYKFTRGSWIKVETGKNNEYIKNRVVKAAGQDIVLSIENWQDLGGGRRFSYLVFYYFAIAFQGVGLLLLIFRIKKKKPTRTTRFYAINVYIILAYTSTVFYHILSPIWQSYIVLIGQTLIFCWGPLLYFLISSFNNTPTGRYWWIHFCPFLLAFMFMILRFFNLEAFSDEQVITTSGVLFSSFYIVSTLRQARYSLYRANINSPKDNFVKLFVILNLVALATVYLYLFWAYIDFEVKVLKNYDLTFISVSFLVILETYYIWRYPELLRKKKIIKTSDRVEKIVDHLTFLMEEEKVYRSQDLSIASLSDQLNTKSHILSKVLNEKYNQSFRDFVNAYRIREFIHQAESGKLKTYTYLGLAHEVGFNSKSTFNLAFKKYTKQSPSEFVKTMLSGRV